jgi:peptidyl-tRNA hydrolase
MGQLANHLGERDKGKLPSQAVNNPKACSIGNSSNQEHVQGHFELWEKSGQSSGGPRNRPF